MLAKAVLETDRCLERVRDVRRLLFEIDNPSIIRLNETSSPTKREVRPTSQGSGRGNSGRAKPKLPCARDRVPATSNNRGDVSERKPRVAADTTPAAVLRVAEVQRHIVSSEQGAVVIESERSSWPIQNTARSHVRATNRRDPFPTHHRTGWCEQPYFVGASCSDERGWRFRICRQRSHRRSGGVAIAKQPCATASLTAEGNSRR